MPRLNKIEVQRQFILVEKKANISKQKCKHWLKLLCSSSSTRVEDHLKSCNWYKMTLSSTSRPSLTVQQSTSNIINNDDASIIHIDSDNSDINMNTKLTYIYFNERLQKN